MTTHQNIFNQDHYPTPEYLVEQILEGINLTGLKVLEPSSGSGNILNYLNEKGALTYSCEINRDLAQIAATKSKFIKYDFLDVTESDISHIDLIVMNPPFSADEKHIIHAFKIAAPQTEIISLCNWNTLSNPFSSSRKELQALIENYGKMEYLGEAFAASDRPTNVEIGLVRLKKGGEKEEDFDEYFTDEEDDYEQQSNGLMRYNEVRDIVKSYVTALKLHDQAISIGVQMDRVTKGMFVKDFTFVCKEGDQQRSREEFAKELQKKSWVWIINKMNLNKYSTTSLMADINKFVEEQQKLKFTMKNIYKMLDLIIQTSSQRMDKAILEVFENLTKHTHENRWNVEGWKTNSHYLINQKFIMPWIAEVGYDGKAKAMYDGYCARQLDDLMKAMCFLTGRNYNNTKTLYSYTAHGGTNIEFGKWFDWEFFQVRLYKKRTGHFKFKNDSDWAILNQNIARILGYPLPETIKKK